MPRSPDDPDDTADPSATDDPDDLSAPDDRPAPGSDDTESSDGRARAARARLSRDLIVATAIGYIGDHGFPGLSMRRLGTVLGVEAMSLYRYVAARDDLLDAVVETLVDEMEHDPDVITVPTHGWQDFLQRIAHGIRRVALRHPRAFPLVASRPADAPWLRPPLRSLRWVEAFLAGLEQEGFSDEAAVAAYRAFTSFLLGHLLLEVAAHGADLSPLDVLEDDVSKPLTDFPTVARLAPYLREDQSAVEFEESLENLLDRIARIKSEV